MTREAPHFAWLLDPPCSFEQLVFFFAKLPETVGCHSIVGVAESLRIAAMNQVRVYQTPPPVEERWPDTEEIQENTRDQVEESDLLGDDLWEGDLEAALYL